MLKLSSFFRSKVAHLAGVMPGNMDENAGPGSASDCRGESRSQVQSEAKSRQITHGTATIGSRWEVDRLIS